MKYTYKQIVSSLPKKKNSKSSFWVQLVVRRISFPVTYLLINCGMSANQVSVFSIFVAALGGAVLCVDSFGMRLAGVLLINFWLVLDCVDGNIARCKQKSTYIGEFFDAIGGYSVFAFSTIGISIAGFNTSFLLPANSRHWLIFIGGLGAVCNLFARLIYQKYTNSVFTTHSILGISGYIPENQSENKRDFSYIRERIEKEISVSGAFMLLLFLALFADLFDVLTVVYSTYYILAFIVTLIMYGRKATLFEKSLDRKINKT